MFRQYVPRLELVSSVDDFLGVFAEHSEYHPILGINISGEYLVRDAHCVDLKWQTKKLKRVQTCLKFDTFRIPLGFYLG